MSDKYKFSKVWRAIKKLLNPYPDKAFTLKIQPSNLSVDRELKKSFYYKIVDLPILYNLWKKGEFVIKMIPDGEFDFNMFVEHKDISIDCWSGDILKNNSEYSDENLVTAFSGFGNKADELYETIVGEICLESSDDSSSDDINLDDSSSDAGGGYIGGGDHGDFIKKNKNELE